jgi:hypothetical protein
MNRQFFCALLTPRCFEGEFFKGSATVFEYSRDGSVCPLAYVQ